MKQKAFASQVVMSVLSATLSLVSTIGNGSFLAIFVRFKNLRNFPNFLFANLAVVDFLNAIINVPLYVLYFVWETSWFKGKTWAIISSSLHLEFTLLNIVSMFALMLDRFLALYLDLRYFTWKTTKKAYAAVVIIWLVCTVPAAIFTISASFDLDLDDRTIGESRAKIYDHRKRFVASVMALFTAVSTLLGILTSYTIYRNKKQRIILNLPPLQAEARVKQDIKATKTVATAVVTYFICYIPAVVYAAWRRSPDDTIVPWVSFLTAICTFISSASNPIIYVLRNRRYRVAIRQLVKDPFGSSPFRERPLTNAKTGEIQRPKNSRGDHKAEQLQSEESGACARPEDKLNGEATVATTATSQMSQSRKMVKIAWQENEDTSLPDEACENGFEEGEGEKEKEI